MCMLQAYFVPTLLAWLVRNSGVPELNYLVPALLNMFSRDYATSCLKALEQAVL